MSRQVNRREVRVPLRPIDQLEKSMEDYESRMRDFVRDKMRSAGSSLDHREARKLLKQDAEYRVVGETSFDEVIELMNSEQGQVANDRIDEDADVEQQGLDLDSHDLGDYLEYFFLDEEVETVHEIEISMGDFMSWDRSFYISGYSEHRDEMDYGPAGVFQGPEMKYAQVNIVREDGEHQTLFPRSSVMSMQVHPGHQLEVYAEEEDVENYEEILE